LLHERRCTKTLGFCHTLRHDGVDYGDYIEQLTYLLFLKMTSEREIDLTKSPGKTRKENTPRTARGATSPASPAGRSPTITLRYCAS